jgi:VWFA-related protein
LSKISSNNKSPLFDVIAEAIKSTKEKRQAPRGGVIVIIDGHSSSGTAFDREVADAILRENTPIYFIILDDGRYGSHPANQSRIRQTRNLLIRIAEVSGGQAVVVKITNDISVATEQIIRRVNNLYTLGYYPTNEKYDGSFRYIRVRVMQKDKRKVRVFVPLGYYAPGPEQIREEKTNDK